MRFIVIGGSLLLLSACGSSGTGTPDDAADGTDLPGEADDGAEIPDVPAEADLPEGDDGADVPAEADGADGAEDGGSDAGDCIVWTLVDAPTLGVQAGDPEPAVVGRTFRIRVEHLLDCQQDRAMPAVTVDAAARRVVVQPRIWDRPRDCMGPAVLVSRWIPLVPTAAGRWVVESPPGTEALTIDVGPEPATPCAAGGPCDEDCDCPSGEVCLGGWGIGGPFTACGVPCEEDQDCPNGSACTDVDDGFERACSDGIPACGVPGRDCPPGFVCEARACVPDFRLGAADRIPCACDADCNAPLRCLAPSTPGGTRRCEFPCPSAGAWCPGAHACGPAAADLSGLASTDSVCGWLGD